MTLNEIYNQVTGVVLAGGQSRRFGRDKALASFEQTTMLAHAIALLRAAAKQVLVVTHPGRDYLGLDAKILHDIYPDHGPLGGIYTACRYTQTPYMLILTCDMPLLSPRIIFHLLHSHERNMSVSIYRHKNKLQPFPGLYATQLAPLMKTQIANGHLSMQGFLNKVPDIAKIPAPAEDSEFTNVNTQEELSNLQRL